MSQKEPSFRQKFDEYIWLGQIREQDKPELSPYMKWSAAQEQQIHDRLCSAGKRCGKGLFTMCAIGSDETDLMSANESIQSCETPYMIISSGEIRFSPNAVRMFALAVRNGKGENQPDFVYCDEDRMDSEGELYDPYFKPGWSPDTLMSFLYVGNAGVFRTALLKEVGGLRREYGAAAYYDLVLRVTERAKSIRHIPMILYHMLSYERDAKAEVRVKEDALVRRGLRGTVEWNEEYREAEVRYLAQEDPLVSIIIPSKDHSDMLKECLRSIREHTRSARYELILVDNGSCSEEKERIEEYASEYHAKYLYRRMPFNFSAMCNLGAERASGEYLLFLNDDTIVRKDNWLEIMLGQAQLSHAGAVGAKLLYPEDNIVQNSSEQSAQDPASGRKEERLIQHAGIINLLIGPVHALMGKTDQKDWYYHRNRVTYDFCAVTGACMMVSRKKYKKAGGMDERLSIAYNDVALCFRFLEMGYYNCVRNDVELLHLESVSRGLDSQTEKKRERLAEERRLLNQTFPAMAGKDPFYNRNLTQKGNDYCPVLSLAERPYGRLNRPLPSGNERIPYAIDSIQSIDDTWEITGWISAGRWKEYAVERYLALEDAAGEGIYFRLNRIRMDDEKLDRIRDRKGKLFTPYVWFHIYIGKQDVQADQSYEIVLLLKEGTGRILCVRTGQFLKY